ncbi:MAG: Spo0E family sporulation regulatory protein-aspartic acid phosphatase [Firmicutes bacterium]|nr:Spo0E family sporulation regulatory protein-aspartic acid phosphatase [Bacillota bacterium]
MNQTKEPTKDQKTELKTKIAAARSSLSTLWDAKGHIDREVLKVSTELDLLVTEYTRLAQKQPPQKKSS